MFVEASNGQALEVIEGPDVLPQGGLQILGFDEAEILPPGIGQHVAEGVHPPSAFRGKVEVIGGVIHLRLLPRSGLEATTGRGAV